MPGSGALALQVEEGQRDDASRRRGRGGPRPSTRPGAACRAPRSAGGTEASADRLLQDRAPAVARELADLAVAARREHGHGDRSTDGRDRGRQALAPMKAARCRPSRAAAPTRRRAGPPRACSRAGAPAARRSRPCRGRRAGPAPSSNGRVVLLGVERVPRRRVVDLEQDEARLEPDDVERQHARRPDAVRAARRPSAHPTPRPRARPGSTARSRGRPCSRCARRRSSIAADAATARRRK